MLLFYLFLLPYKSQLRSSFFSLHGNENVNEHYSNYLDPRYNLDVAIWFKRGCALYLLISINGGTVSYDLHVKSNLIPLSNAVDYDSSALFFFFFANF